MISSRVIRAIHINAGVAEKEKLAQALAKVVEALERQSHPHVESFCKERAQEALTELERALGECGV